jgi:hypothetical protein
MKKLLTLTFLALTFTSCSTIKSSLNEWKNEIKEDMASGNDFNKSYPTYPNIKYSDNQPKSKVESIGYDRYYNLYYNPYYIPTYYIPYSTYTPYTPTYSIYVPSPYELGFTKHYTSWGGVYWSK